jgi:excisionase family DNA binding protein
MSDEQYIPLSELAEGTPYSQEYLSLLARKGKIPAQKVGRSWCSTREAVEQYVKEQAQFYQGEIKTDSVADLTEKINEDKSGMRGKTILLALGCVVLAIVTLWVLNEYFSRAPTIVLPEEQKQPDYSIRVDDGGGGVKVFVAPSE